MVEKASDYNFEEHVVAPDYEQGPYVDTPETDPEIDIDKSQLEADFPEHLKNEE